MFIISFFILLFYSEPFVLKDLFSQLLLAHSSDCPWDSLLTTSFEIENPVLAILSASYPVSI